MISIMSLFFSLNYFGFKSWDLCSILQDTVDILPTSYENEK